jgi:type III secretory pathway component EscU
MYKTIFTLILIAIMSTLSILIFNSEDISTVLSTNILLKIGSFSLAVSATFLVLRVFDYIIKYDFNIKNISIPEAIYLSSRLFAVSYIAANIFM